MSFSAIFIKRPIATSLLALGLMVAGILSFFALPVSPLPQVEFPTIRVQANLSGASPEIMSTSIAAPLERQLGRIAGVTQMTSKSSLGTTHISIQFDLSRNIDGAARDVQAAMNAAQSELPANLPNRPTYRKANPAEAPVMVMALTSDQYTKADMYDFASTILQPRILQVLGVGDVNIGGAALPSIRVEVNPTALNKYGLDVGQIRSIISAENMNMAQGNLVKGSTTSTILVNDQLKKPAEYAPLILKVQNGSVVRLSDVASVTEGSADVRNMGLANGKPAVLLIIYKEPGANIIETVDAINALLPSFKAAMPAAINLFVLMDRTTTIRTSLHEVELSLIAAMLLVIMVSFLFLQNARAMLITGVAVPLSLLGACCFMQVLGFSLNNLSLMALTIATGFVVDDAIVVLENIARHIENGMQPFAAALKGTQEVTFTVISMSISLVAVFIPILFMGGMVGRLFREFTLTLCAAIFVSLIISLTVTPMLCAQFLNAQHFNKRPPWLKRWNNFYDKSHAYYAKTLAWSLTHGKIIVSVLLGAIVLSIVLFSFVSKGFFPQQDTGRVTASIVAQQNVSFDQMQKKVVALAAIVKADPGIANVAAFVGGGSSNTGFMFISLKPLNVRKISADKIIARLRQPLTAVEGIKLYMQSAQDIQIGGRQGNAQFQYTFSGASLEDLDEWMPKIIEKLSSLPGIADINSDQQNHGLQMMVHVDQAAAARYGLNSQMIDRVLYANFGQSKVTTLYGPKNQYSVIMEVAKPFRDSPNNLAKVYLHNNKGNLIPLSAIATFKPRETLLLVNHQGQSPSATLSFNLLPGYPLGDAVAAVNGVIQQMHLPTTIHGSFKGSAQAFQESLKTTPFLILAALITIYIVLGILYESLIHPLTILSTLPSAGVGALLALLLTRTQFTVIALIGIILLMGIVKKNAIMMVDFAIVKKRTENISSHAAIYEASLLRFRPIMMTSMATLLGALPLAIGMGQGSEFRQPLGIAVVGGLLLSQLLTLYTTPVIYLLMEKWKLRKLKYKFTK